MIDIKIDDKFIGKVENGTFFRVIRKLGRNNSIIFTQLSINKALQEGARQVVVHEIKTGLLYLASMQALTRIGTRYSDKDGVMYVGLNKECMVIVQKDKSLVS